MKTKSYSHCHGESSFHIVFSPKYRHYIFGKDEIKTLCEKALCEVALKWGVIDSHSYGTINIIDTPSNPEIITIFY